MTSPTTSKLSAVYGRFDAKDPYPAKPVITAYFKHPLLKFERTLEFVVDTGASKTFISPDWQDTLQISKGNFESFPNPQITITGYVSVVCLRRCSLRFALDAKGEQVYVVENLPIIFLPARIAKSARKHHRGVGMIPNILGNDVLNTFGLFCCNTTNQVLLTRDFKKTSAVIYKHF